MTAIKSQLERAGIDTHRVRLESIARDALKMARGDIERASMALWMQVKSVPEFSRILCADYLKSLRSEGHGCFDDQRKNANAPQPDSDGRGQNKLDPHDGNAPPVAPNPKKKPTLKQPPRGSIARMTIFDRTRTESGRKWSEIHWHELPSMVRAMLDSQLAKELMKIDPQVTTNKKVLVCEVIKPKEFEEALNKASSL